MLVLSVQATAFETTCYLVTPGRGGPCLVIDPGAGVASEVRRLVEAHELVPVAAAATHGHPDHVWDAAAVCDSFNVPFLIHGSDRDRLADPAAALGSGMGAIFESLVEARWRPPARVEALPPGPTLDLDLAPDLALQLIPAPGHTPGSTIFLAHAAPSPGCDVPPSIMGLALPATTAMAFTGDVLFAGSIGRTDLPGGDVTTMRRTLRELRRAIPAEAWVLPGHGPSSTMAHESVYNPYLGVRWPSPDLF